MLTLVALLGAAHVPIYGGCVENCCVPPRHHSVSQVIYLRGAGGVEVHARGVIDFDAVFRDEVDPSTYDLHVGCGGCLPSDALAPLRPIEGYLPAEVEPFTQTAHRSVFPKDRRVFNASECSDHFTVRLVEYGNATEPIVWGAVVGLGESFTPRELFEFPLYILRNHGDAWNDLAFTYWVWLAVGALAVFAAWRPNTPRAVLLAFSLVGFVAAALEELTHLLYAQSDAPLGYGFWVGLFLVIAVAQGAGALAVWGAARAHTLFWVPLELVVSVGLLFLLGSGLFVGPFCLALASLMRLFPERSAPSPPPAKAVMVVTPRRRFERV